MVLAGAGSGKTTVLTTRAALLLTEQRIFPENILLVTFTNKAANEMKERISRITGSTLPLAGTFHSLCAKILRVEGRHVGLDSNFVIYDSSDQLALIKEIYDRHSLDKKEFNINATKASISKAKNELLSISKYEEVAYGAFQAHVARVYKLYQHYLAQAQAVDFDDLMLKVVDLFTLHPYVLEKYQSQISHVLVDEYQDTNKAQYALTKFFTRPHDNLYVVGDFSQSIYAWRGADYRNMMLLEKDFPGTTRYQLEQNYRSSQVILDAATEVISHNTSHPILQLWTENIGQDKIVCYEAESGDDEARQVIRFIRSELDTYQANDIAILYRTNAQSRLFEEALIRAHIPYRLVGGTKFYDRKEVKDLISYLRLAVNPLDAISHKRLVKLGKKRLEKFEAWRENNKTLITEINPGLAVKEILDVTEYLDRFDDQDPEDVSRVENINELLAVASQFESITQLLENIALIQDSYFIDEVTQEKQEQAITLMSLHSAKGLEFCVVFMVGMEDGLLPHSRSILDREQMEEERRLCYVGITRAKHKLYLTHARSRYVYGSSSGALRSRFINDIPEELLDYQSSSPYASQRSSGFGYGQKRPASGYMQSGPYAGRRLVVDEDMADEVLNGEIDLDAFIES